MNGESFPDNLHLSDPWIAAITPGRIARSLRGFPLNLQVGWSLPSLARAIQDVANRGRGRIPQSDADARKELERLAKLAGALSKGLADLGETADLAAFFDLLRRVEERGESISLDEVAYRSMLHEPIELAANVFARAASQVGTRRSQAPKWRAKVAQDMRVSFALGLAPTFEAAFACEAKVNNWQADFGKEHPWADFYRRVYLELFPETEKLNLSEVLQEASNLRPKIESMQASLEQQ